MAAPCAVGAHARGAPSLRPRGAQCPAPSASAACARCCISGSWPRAHSWTPSSLALRTLSLRQRSPPPHPARGRGLRAPAGGRHRTVALFTGIVEEMGEVVRLEELQEQGGNPGWTLEVRAEHTLHGTQLGDSIAVNGTCLTVTSLTPDSSFTFGLAPETLRCTSLGELKAGSAVNLERSLRPDSRMGGHFVQGHVDATGTIREFWTEGDSLWVRVQAPRDLMPFIVPKGYIAVDGTSLTVCDVNDEDSTFTFMLVAYTQQKIVVAKKSIGSQVNLEVDILGKYVVRMINAMKATPSV